MSPRAFPTRVLVLGAVLCLTALPDAQSRALPDREAFLAEVRTRLIDLGSSQRGYVFEVTRREQSLDADGRTTDESVKVYESFPGLPGKERWERLIAEDGQPVPPSDLAEQDRKRAEAVRSVTRRQTRDPEAAREQQTHVWEEYLRDMSETVDDIFRVYDIRMLGREVIAGHDTIAFALTPRPDADPRGSNGERMRSFVIQAWVSESDHELVRVEAETIDTVKIWWGLLARIHPGSTISYERQKVNDEDWLPARLQYRGSARIGLVRVIRRSGSEEYSGYRKLADDDDLVTTTLRPGDVE
jgi:hypothetical protein